MCQQFRCVFEFKCIEGTAQASRIGMSTFPFQRLTNDVERMIVQLVAACVTQECADGVDNIDARIDRPPRRCGHSRLPGHMRVERLTHVQEGPLQGMRSEEHTSELQSR